MGVTDTYNRLKTVEKNELFEEIFVLKEEKSQIEKRLKELEAQYKPMLGNLEKNLFFITTSGIRFSIKKATRKGSIDAKVMEEDGIDVDSYRKASSVYYTLRKDK